MIPKLEILPGSQRQLWDELVQIPSEFTLYGGTAIALWLGHRTSVDFDFFTDAPLNLDGLLALDMMRGADVLQEEPNTLTVSVDRKGPIKVSFFGRLNFGRVGEPETTSGHVRIASLLDLTATKLKVLLQRVEPKDYLDLAALIRAGVHLADGLAAARVLFGHTFNPLVAQKTLCFFEGIEELDEDTMKLLVREAAQPLSLPVLEKCSDKLS